MDKWVVYMNKPGDVLNRGYYICNICMKEIKKGEEYVITISNPYIHEDTYYVCDMCAHEIQNRLEG